jgi:hypothetical protein
MASGIGRVIDGFRLDEFALRAFENLLLRAVGVRLSALQLHSGSTHGAARGLIGSSGGAVVWSDIGRATNQKRHRLALQCAGVDKPAGSDSLGHRLHEPSGPFPAKFGLTWAIRRSSLICVSIRLA